MIGKYKNGKLINCPKCNCKYIEHLDHSLDVEYKEVKIVYDVECKECSNEFQIIDVFIYQYSKK